MRFYTTVQWLAEPLRTVPAARLSVVGATGPTGIHVEGAKAMSEYEANIRAVREKTARLRALRLAKEASANDAHLTKKIINSK